MNGERWRCFVAVPIAEALRNDLRSEVARWRTEEAVSGLRWTDPEAWHVTLAFIGATEPPLVPEHRDRLAAVAGAHAATISVTGGLGAFPSPARARVAWYGVEDQDGRLARLAADVAATLGLDASRPFRPHLTLARARRQPVDLRSWIASASAPAGVLTTDRIQLMRSHTGRGPARYETLASLKLGVPARV